MTSKRILEKIAKRQGQSSEKPVFDGTQKHHIGKEVTGDEMFVNADIPDAEFKFLGIDDIALIKGKNVIVRQFNENAPFGLHPHTMIFFKKELVPNLEITSQCIIPSDWLTPVPKP